MKIHSITDISKRENNQDNYWCAVLNVNGSQVGVLCVCDGMGGLDCGEKASELVVSNIRKHFLENGTIEGIEDVVDSANESIKNLSSNRSGTTCTVLMCSNGNYYVYNVGDSRCYIWNSAVTQITEDHTVLQKYRNEGKEITRAIEVKYKNVLTKCVGVMNTVKYDIFTGSYQSGDRFLVCSDGFWHTIDEDDFLSGRILNLEDMVKRCLEKGELDNITACILEV